MRRLGRGINYMHLCDGYAYLGCQHMHTLVIYVTVFYAFVGSLGIHTSETNFTACLHFDVIYFILQDLSTSIKGWGQL